MDYGLPSFSVHDISQQRILGWICGTYEQIGLTNWLSERNLLYVEDLLCSELWFSFVSLGLFLPYSLSTFNSVSYYILFYRLLFSAEISYKWILLSETNDLYSRRVGMCKKNCKMYTYLHLILYWLYLLKILFWISLHCKLRKMIHYSKSLTALWLTIVTLRSKDTSIWQSWFLR